MVALQGTLLGATEPRVDDSAAIERIDLGAGSWIDLARAWLHGADTLLDALVDCVDWRHGRRWMYDRMVDDPRLSRWYRREHELPHDAFGQIRAALTEHYDVELGGFGLNYYRDGSDSVAFHRDRELRRLDNTLIAIVTLGATRPFLVRPLGGGRSRDLRPGSGDLLVMGGRCQLAWEHGVPKVVHAGPRISLTLRWAKNHGRSPTPPSG
ncbi:MAG: alpha-ketoglutarate-dependent dioxygenase AlkB [Acidimicrobiia bacterium]